MLSAILAATMFCASPVLAQDHWHDLAALRAVLVTDPLRVAEAALGGLRKAAAEDETAEWIDVLLSARIATGEVYGADTIEIARQGVALRRRLDGAGDLRTARTALALARLLFERGDFTLALAQVTQVRLVTANLSADWELTVEAHLTEAEAALALEQFPRAAAQLDTAGRLLESDERSFSSLALRRLYLLALSRRLDGHYDEAREYLARYRAEAARSSLLRDIPVQVRQLDGELMFLAGGFVQASQAWQAALDGARESVHGDAPVIRVLTREIAAVTNYMGDVGRARQLLERLRASLHGDLRCERDRPALLSDLASLARYDGDYSRSQQMYAEALRESERCLGRAHSQTATIVHNQANLAATRGDSAEAERLWRNAVARWRLTLGNDHPYVARGLDNLAGALTVQGRIAEAQRVLTTALRIRRTRLGEQHADVAVTLASLAQLLLANNRLAAAKAKLRQANDIFSNGTQPQDPDYQAGLYLLEGDLALASGDTVQARALFDKALALREAHLGSRHPLYGQVLERIGDAQWDVRDRVEAFASAAAAERIGQEHLVITSRGLPERQALLYATTRPRGLDLMLTIATEDQARAADAFDAVVRSRALIQDELAARASVANQAADQSALPALHAARSRYAALMVRSVEDPAAVPAAFLIDARQRLEEAEQSLAANLQSGRSPDQVQIDGETVRASLPAGTALVSFVEYSAHRLTFVQGVRRVTKTAAFAAFVVTAHSRRVTIVPIGPSSDVERAVRAWRESVDPASGQGDGTAPTQPSLHARGTRLAQMVWGPLQPLLAGAANVFIVPDGILNTVNFVALPTAPGRYLAESGPSIHELSAERDVARPPSQQKGQGLLLVGGAAYGEPPPTSSAPVSVSGCRPGGALRFADLPGTNAEIRDIGAIWRGTQASPVIGAVRMLEGRSASERTVMREVGGKRVVHLATHGFVLSDRCRPAGLPGSRGVGGLLPMPAASAGTTRSPLSLAGLAFAGANRRTRANDGADDGIITAEEVASLNLQGVEWAVLSACDTGLGEIRAGEGVLGLRRAFQIAGARTVIMSLWAVEDRATREWMRFLYEGRFQKHLTTVESVRYAQVSTLNARRVRGESTNPRYWAAFVAAGDWN